MILGFDIGNTSTLAGLFPGDSAVPEKIFRYKTEKKASCKNFTASMKRRFRKELPETARAGISGIAFSSVVPEVNHFYHEMAHREFGIGCVEINSQCRLSIRIGYKNPAELGADRIVNAEAAFREHGGGIVADLGTALTFTVVLPDGTLAGGIIAPGIETAIKSLSRSASQLPEIEFGKPESLIARDKVNAIKSGFFWGWISLVEGLAARIRKECGYDLKLILTGGYSSAVSEYITIENIADPLLTIRGIKYVYDLN